MKYVYLLLDVGGTQIKTGIDDERRDMVGKIVSFPSLAKAGRNEIFDHFAMILKNMIQRAGLSTVAGIGMAFPGPFDYEKGISRMKGLDKYKSIYGASIEVELKKREKKIAGVKFEFLHDVEAFALGESRFGAANGHLKLLCLCLGTGTGSAFIYNKCVALPLHPAEDGIVEKEKSWGIPANGWIYDTPYKDSVIDDYLSVRGLAKISREMLGEELDGKALYERCVCGEESARKVYKAFGKDLSTCILPFAEAFQPNAIVFGGQISGSFSYFGGELKEKCRKRGIQIYLEPETSLRAMQGLFSVMRGADHDYAKS